MLFLGCLVFRELGNNTREVKPCPPKELTCVYHGHASNHNNSWAAVSTCIGVVRFFFRTFSLFKRIKIIWRHILLIFICCHFVFLNAAVNCVSYQTKIYRHLLLGEVFVILLLTNVITPLCSPVTIRLITLYFLQLNLLNQKYIVLLNSSVHFYMHLHAVKNIYDNISIT